MPGETVSTPIGVSPLPTGDFRDPPNGQQSILLTTCVRTNTALHPQHSVKQDGPSRAADPASPALAAPAPSARKASAAQSAQAPARYAAVPFPDCTPSRKSPAHLVFPRKSVRKLLDRSASAAPRPATANQCVRGSPETRAPLLRRRAPVHAALRGLQRSVSFPLRRAPAGDPHRSPVFFPQSTLPADRSGTSCQCSPRCTPAENRHADSQFHTRLPGPAQFLYPFLSW